VQADQPPKQQGRTASVTRGLVTPRLVGLLAWALPEVRQPVRLPAQRVEAQPPAWVSAQEVVARLQARMSVVRLPAWARAQPEKALRELVLARQGWPQALMPV
jgi:hypothetical protein